MQMEGRSSLITGGTGALGTVIAKRFVDEGARVTITLREPKDLERLPPSMQRAVLPLQADVTSEADVSLLFDKAEQGNGPVEVLVNTVGGFLPRTEIPNTTLEQWNKMMDINLKSAFLCTREALRRMNGKPYGRIINISAMTGMRPSPGRAAYAISKAAVALFTEIAAQEQKGTGITVNAIAPSIIDTEANRASMPDEDYSKWVKRERIADIICYLCSDVAKDITGTIIKAYGGM
jgi:NAD(P)-dependent dehydrogenase (short-subunit alcohol dehydrogenase family)